MSEENKQEVEKPKEAEQKEPVVKEEAVKKEEKPVEKPAEASAAAQTPKAEAAPARVKASNCKQCNKVLKRGNWYYRNGIFYCNKRCWKKSTEKVAE